MGPTKSRHVALLRGVNVGKANRVSMTDLRSLFEGLGFRAVRTLLNSGNVVFTSPDNKSSDVAGRIEKALAARLGLASAVTVLSGDEVAEAVGDNPFTGARVNPSWLLVIGLRERPDRDRLKPLLKERWDPERLAIGRRVAYLWCAKGIRDSRLWTAVDRALDRTCTARNMATITKLMELVQEA